MLLGFLDLWGLDAAYSNKGASLLLSTRSIMDKSGSSGDELYVRLLAIVGAGRFTASESDCN